MSYEYCKMSWCESTMLMRFDGKSFKVSRAEPMDMYEYCYKHRMKSVVNDKGISYVELFRDDRDNRGLENISYYAVFIPPRCKGKREFVLLGNYLRNSIKVAKALLLDAYIEQKSKDFEQGSSTRDEISCFQRMREKLPKFEEWRMVSFKDGKFSIINEFLHPVNRTKYHFFSDRPSTRDLLKLEEWEHMGQLVACSKACEEECRKTLVLNVINERKRRFRNETKKFNEGIAELCKIRDGI